MTAARLLNPRSRAGLLRLPSSPARRAVTVPPGAIVDAGGKVASGSVERADDVEYDLGALHSTPHAPTTHMRFWNSANPHAPGVLIG